MMISPLYRLNYIFLLKNLKSSDLLMLSDNQMPAQLYNNCKLFPKRWVSFSRKKK